MYNSLILRNSYLAEVNLSQVPAVGQRINFLDIPELRDVYTIGIEAFTAAELLVSPNSRPLITTALGIALTLAVKDTERFIQIPIYTLVSALNSGLIREFANLQFTLNKCYITLFDVTSLNQFNSVCFNFYYNRTKPK